MIKSMTGFSRGEISEAGVNVTVEVKSLNGKYLEVNLRMPRNLQHFEGEIREIVKENVARGSLQMNINLEIDAQESPFALDESAVGHTYAILQEMRKVLKIKETIKMEHILKFSDDFVSKNEIKDEKLLISLIKRAVRNALRSLDTMRKREGGQIAKDIKNRLYKIADTVDIIEKKGFDRIPEEREKLRRRVAQLFESDEIDEQRLQMEMVVMADKLDISEECVRLKSHFKFFDQAMRAKEPSGRKINFLLQEMHREINTIGSKANDADISHKVVDVKEELERIREQVQNIE